MNPERWKNLEQIFHCALERHAESRAAFLETACGQDHELRLEVETLLAQVESSDDFLEPPTGDKASVNPLGGLIGNFQIQSLMGVGGMGEVYRAHDRKLGRDVALKILPVEFARDPERLARFRREARTLALLNHPNIEAIYGIEESEGVVCLVLELVEGQPLQGPLPVQKALAYACQVAEALEAAHEKGIIHRDLKPANVKVTPEGRVKVLDFGLAKAVWAAESKGGQPPAQNLIELGSLAGPIVGTAGYMSPEQSKGEDVDQRSDNWAFGCLLYELLVGKRAFDGKSLQETIEHVQSHEPDWNALPAKTPTKIHELLRRCLEKDAARRLYSIADGRQIIQESLRRKVYWPFAVTGIAILAAGVAIRLGEQHYPRISDPSKWVQLTNFPDSVSQPALSPDGKMLAFIRGPGTFYTPGQVYFKRLPDGDSVQLTDDDLEKMSPVFSPDSLRIAYTTVDPHFQWDTWLVPSSGGKPKRWLENASGLVWIDKERVLFSEIRTGQHMALVTGDEKYAGRRDVYVPAQELGMVHRSYPSPDSRWVLAAEMNGPWLPCRLMPLNGSSAGRTVGPPSGACTSAAWSPDGKWMYFSSSAGGGFHLWRQRFSGGSPEQITSGPSEQEGIAVTPDGRFLITAVGQRQRPLILHKNGHDKQITLEGYAYQPKLTVNGRFLVYRILKGVQIDTDPTQLWVTDLNSGYSEQLAPELSPDSLGIYDVSSREDKVVFAARDRNGADGLWLVRLGESLPPRRIPGIVGNWPVFGESGEIFFRSYDGFVYRVREDGTALAKAVEEPVDRITGISPDRQWLVVSSGQTLLCPLSGGRPINLRGNFVLRWSADGKLLYFESAQVGMSARGAGITYVIPLHRGEVFPKVIRDGLRSEQDLASLPGVQIIEGADVAPGPGVYAYSRETTQRNLFRIPIP